MKRPGSFFGELKRRRVYRVAAVYAVVAIGALELADVLVPATALPEWSEEFFVVLAIVGFPIVVVLAWMFDLTPDGVRKTGERVDEASAPSSERAAVAASPPQADPAVDPPGERTPAPDRPLDPKTIAVLPFQNLSGAADAEPFAAGLHDDLLTELSRASALTVISRTSVQGYRDSTKPMNQIGRELRAGTIVEGGVQKSGDRVRLNVQLIDAVTDGHLWAERYDRELTADTVFDLQTELASRIMASLHATLTGREDAIGGEQPTRDLEAYRQYSIGRALFVGRSEEALRGAAEHFGRAVERDPEYALAWAGLALARIFLVDYRHSDSEEDLVEGEAAARRALELDPQLAEAHSALGGLHSARRRCRESLEAHQRAIELRPSYAAAHHWRCWTSLLIGDPDTARAAGARAVELDPLDPEGRGNLGLAHLGCGDDESALSVALGTLENHPDFDYARWVAALALQHLGRHGQASEMLLAMTDPWTKAWPATTRAFAAIDAGDVGEARRLLAGQKEAGSDFHAALIEAALPDPSPPLEALCSTEWDEALYVRYFRGEPLRSLRERAGWGRLIDDLDRAWGA